MNIDSSELEEQYCLVPKGLVVPSEVAEEVDLEEDQASLQTSPEHEEDWVVSFWVEDQVEVHEVDDSEVELALLY